MTDPDLPIPAPSRWAALPTHTPDHAPAAPPRPQPVQARLDWQPANALLTAAIELSADPRLDTPLYAIHTPHQRRPVVLTHAQLAALVLAANALFATCHHAGVPQ